MSGSRHFGSICAAFLAAVCVIAPSPTVLAVSPSPSPAAYPIKDGDPWIAYTWLVDCTDQSCGTNSVYLVRPDGRDRHLLLDVPVSHPDWSPDGKRIAVDTEPEFGEEIWLVDVDGTNKTVMTCDGSPCGPVAAPAWSPDGTKLAFQRAAPRKPGQEYDRVAIEVVDLVTGATHVATVSPAAGSEYVEYNGPRWSPDGTQIVFTAMRYPVPPTDENIKSSSIAVVKADGSESDNPRILTDPALFGAYPDWSPDGERIVFNTYPLSSFQETTKAMNLYTVRPDGTDLTQVTHYPENDTRAVEPTWTPDGRRIAFSAILRNPTFAPGERLLALIDPDDSDLTFIPAPPDSRDPVSLWYGSHMRMRPTH